MEQIWMLLYLATFDVVEKSVNPNFQNTGTWYEYFAAESMEVTDVNLAITLAPGEYLLFSSKKIRDTYTPTNINEIQNGEVADISLKAYPNPVFDKISVEFSLANRIENAQIGLYNVSGQKVLEIYSGELKRGQHQLSYPVNEQLAKGIYILRMTGRNIAANEILVVE
jgi:hypothetical protein